MVLMVTMTIERPMALLYSMISGRKPMVIMVVPKPSALLRQTFYTPWKECIWFSKKNSSDYCSIICCDYERFSVRGKK